MSAKRKKEGRRERERGWRRGSQILMDKEKERKGEDRFGKPGEQSDRRGKREAKQRDTH